jgi:hypothetical protein
MALPISGCSQLILFECSRKGASWHAYTARKFSGAFPFRSTMVLRSSTRSAGGIDLLTVSLDALAWTRLITGGLEQKVISLA